MDVNATEIWNQSQEYLAVATEHLNPQLLRSRQIRSLYDEKEWLRISFLFPTLPEKSKMDLLAVRRFFLIAREEQRRQRTNPQTCAEYSEAMADEAATQLKEALPSFSKTQRDILKKHYLIKKDEH